MSWCFLSKASDTAYTYYENAFSGSTATITTSGNWPVSYASPYNSIDINATKLKYTFNANSVYSDYSIDIAKSDNTALVSSSYNERNTDIVWYIEKWASEILHVQYRALWWPASNHQWHTLTVNKLILEVGKNIYKDWNPVSPKDKLSLWKIVECVSFWRLPDKSRWDWGLWGWAWWLPLEFVEKQTITVSDSWNKKYDVWTLDYDAYIICRPRIDSSTTTAFYTSIYQNNSSYWTSYPYWNALSMISAWFVLWWRSWWIAYNNSVWTVTMDIYIYRVSRPE